jgi:DNA-binding XRE family transcriptional regulator
MKSKMVIKRDWRIPSTRVTLSGSAGRVSFEFVSRLRPRQRRALAVAFFRRVRPFIEEFTRGDVFHSDGSTDFRRNEVRGLTLFPSAEFDSTLGRLGYAIRTARLNKGLTQRATARKARISRKQLSIIERGLSCPHKATLQRLERVLDLPLPARGRREKVANVTSAQRKKFSEEES